MVANSVTVPVAVTAPTVTKNGNPGNQEKFFKIVVLAPPGTTVPGVVLVVGIPTSCSTFEYSKIKNKNMLFI